MRSNPQVGVARKLAPFVVVMAVLAVVVALVPASAMAGVTHPSTGSFGPDGAGGTASFERVGGVAVDQSTGDLFVYDSQAGKIYKFDAAGGPVNFSSTGTNAIPNIFGGGLGETEIAVAPAGSPGGTAGDIYVANSGNTLKVFSSAGEKIAELDSTGQGGENCGVATDPAGNLYIGVYPGTVVKYVPTANPPIKTDKSAELHKGLVGICNVAADGAGNVYAATYNGRIVKFEGMADETPTTIDSLADTMGVDPTSGDLFANYRAGVDQYSGGGAEFLGGFGGAQLNGAAQGVAVNSASGTIYVGNREKVAVFGGPVTGPDAISAPASGVRPTKATLNGSVGAAGGPNASCEFEYVSSADYRTSGFGAATSVPCQPAGPFAGTTVTPVKAEVTGLPIFEQTLYRAVAKSSAGTNYGAPYAFENAGAVAVETLPATKSGPTAVILRGSVAPEGQPIEVCNFETSFNGESQTFPCEQSEADIGTGDAPVPVSYKVTGLTAGTVVNYALRVTNSRGTSYGDGLVGLSAGPTATAPELIEVGIASATFTAMITPNEEATSYQFEYVTAQEFEEHGFAGAAVVPAGAEAIGSGTEPVTVTQTATGLAPLSSYRLRLVATNAGGTKATAPVAFSTYGEVPPLPDGRAYEQASPVQKNASNALGSELLVVQASPSGNAISFFADAGAGETEGSQELPIYVAMRGATNWDTDGINPPAATGARSRNLGITTSMNGSYTVAWNPTQPGTLYLRERGGHLVTIASGLAASTGVASEVTNVAAETADGSEVLFETTAKLTPDAISGVPNVYLWTKASGALKLASILPDGSTPSEGAFPGGYHWPSFDSTTYGGVDYMMETAETLSEDGSQVIFETRAREEPEGEDPVARGRAQLYVRKNINSPSATTVEVSKSQKTNGSGPGGTDPNGPQPAKFLKATPSGRFVFFKSNSELTNDANTGPEDEGEDLYRYDTSTGALIDLAPDATGIGAQISGVAGVSDDGSYAYFVATGNLAAGATGEERKLYVWHDGDIRLITPITNSEADTLIWANTRNLGNNINPARNAQATPDGKDLIFASKVERPGYDNHGAQEIYRYDYPSSTLLCVSCNPSRGGGEYDFYPNGGGFFQQYPFPFVSPSLRLVTNPRNLSTDGGRVVFQTAEKLVGKDTNNVQDVYEWEAVGKGSCQAATVPGGCLFLISTGTSADPSYFGDAGETGNSIFFFTTQRLVGQDKDELVDVYDAEVGGGLPAQNPANVVPCVGEACLGQATGTPESTTPGTSTFGGPGNEKPQPKKAKKKHHKKKHKKKHHGKKHHHKQGKGKKHKGNDKMNGTGGR